MNRKAIILVAGMGTRLKPLTASCHKCLTMVNDIPILDNTLEILKNHNFNEIILVIGYLKEQIKNHVGDFYQGMKITYAENDLYSETSTSFSMQIGLEKLCNYEELYVLEGDVFFENKVIEKLVYSSEKNATILEKYNKDLDGTFATLDVNNNVIDWVHKSKRPEGYTLEDKYKTVNIHKFSYEFVDKILMAEINKSVLESRGKEPLETIMQNIVKKDPSAIRGIVLAHERWFEIDDSQDLERAEHIFKGYSLNIV